MRIRDWSSDVCSSDLLEAFLRSSQRCVNGEVTLLSHGGRVDAVAVQSPHILNAKGATYAQSADWGVAEAEGRSEERRVGKSVSVRVDLGGRRIIKKKKKQKYIHNIMTHPRTQL